LPGTFYVLRPSSQSLKMHLSILSGYPSVVPYICPDYGMRDCVKEAHRKITKSNEEGFSNHYLLLSKTVLNQRETISIDFCGNCYWLMYIDCKIGTCQVEFDFNTTLNSENRLMRSQLDLLYDSLTIRTLPSSELTIKCTKTFGNIYVECV
jgi:hypothetical protein